MIFRSVVMAVAVAVACVGPVAQNAIASAGDCPPAVLINDVPADTMEGNPMVFTVVKAAAGTGCTGSAMVHFQTVQIYNSMTAAIMGEDYVATSGTIIWQPGAQQYTISVPTVQDGKMEPVEDVMVCLDSAVNVQITDPCGVGKLSTPWCAWPAPPQTCETCQFHIDLPEPVRQPVLLTYRTQDGTARAGEDYVGIPEARVQIPAGGRSAVLGVDILPNAGSDPEKWFVLEITADWGEHVESVREIVTIGR